MADIQMIDTSIGRHRGKSAGRSKTKLDGYGTDWKAKQIQEDKEEKGIDYADLNDQFGNVSVSGKGPLSPVCRTFERKILTCFSAWCR